jgi:hypothetical protein
VHHQHVSHLFGLFPGHTISVEKTPDLCKAADYTLYKRGSHAITDYLDSKVFFFFFFFFFLFFFAFGLYLIIFYYTGKANILIHVIHLHMPNIIMWDYGSSQLIVTAAAIGQLV